MIARESHTAPSRSATGAFTSEFDAVVMLTWSDWSSEPRSNRYHYASRFAAHVPVLFLQPTLTEGSSLSIEPSGLAQVDVINISQVLNQAAVREIGELLRARGIRRPLLWIYSSVHYENLLASFPGALRVYHATEDYLTPSSQWGSGQEFIASSVKRLLVDVDLLVAVSPKVRDAYVQLGGFDGPTLVAENGCDAGFYEALHEAQNGRFEEKTVVFQGGINRRIDFGLLLALVRRLGDWTFWFCGRVEPGIELWDELVKEPNVQCFGPLEPSEFGVKMCTATVGIIPFVEDAMIFNSLPLKAYEYVACGLPVVSVPIEALRRQPDLFEIVSGADQFADAIVRVAGTRGDPDALANRREAARRSSYDHRFEEVVAGINVVLAGRKSGPRKLNIAVLYDDASVHVSTVREHLEAFRKYSSNQVYFLPATDTTAAPSYTVGRQGGSAAGCDGTALSFFDVVVVHYCVRVSLREHFNTWLARECAAFSGFKVLFIQDEYDTPEITRAWMDRIGFDLVYTCVPAGEVEKIYPRARYPSTEFLPTLTGYVPESPMLDSYALPLAQRRAVIGYRGRKLPLIYGELGYEKYFIGVEMKRLAEIRGINVDIEVDDSMRIYGTDWYRFMGSVRATLGTESGCNLFDFDGTIGDAIKAELQVNPDATYPEVRDKLLVGNESHIQMNQVSPKIFEAIRTRTVLVLFEGEYSGVVEADLHYIPLKKDFSNVDEVFAKLADDRLLEQISTRAYRDVIESGLYSYRAFINAFDEDLHARIRRGPRVELFAVPAFAMTAGGSVDLLLHHAASSYFLSTGLVDRRSSRPLAEGRIETGFAASFQDLPRVAENQAAMQAANSAAAIVMLRRVWSVLPARLRAPLRRRIFIQIERYRAREKNRSLAERGIARAWRLLPESIRRRVRAVFGH